MIRFIMLGGFLGAGKTTAIARLATHYTEQGLKVGIVTNDQAFDLVDTKSLRAQGFDVGEVPGACFCCKFNDLVEVATSLAQENHPDVIITEPVGSCTDLVATVIEPLQQIHGNEYEIAPLVVLLKPEHGKKILGGNSGSGFSPKAAYIFLKQIEEADVIAINKIDKLEPAARAELQALLETRFPGKRVVQISGKTGEGFDQVLSSLQQARTTPTQMMDVDYDIYAAGEAELGWLNCTAVATGATSFALDGLVRSIVQTIANQLRAAAAEAAHLKVLVEAGDNSAIANLVGSDVDVELSVASHAQATQATVVVNARVVCEPEELETMVVNSLQSVAKQDSNLAIEVGAVQRFRPGRPEPTHRVTS